MNSIDKRNSVKKDYDLIADQYLEDYGNLLEDIDLIRKFESYLQKDSTILDLGGGSGILSNYFIQKGFKSVCYDFSKNMEQYAQKNFPNVPFILDDILNVKNHFSDNSVEAITSMY